MPARSSASSLAQRLAENLTPLQVLGCAALLYFADWAFQKSGGSVFPGGPLDETAHLLTALLLLQAVPPRHRAKIIIPALIGSVAIDLDHIPQYLGYDFLTVGTPRPYTHSLMTPLLLLALALAVRRHRAVFLGLALGVLLHFFRDLAEGNGSGVALLWPFSDHAFSYPHSTYLALMACVVAADLLLGALSLRARAAVP
jgi:inner membrane protein